MPDFLQASLEQLELKTPFRIAGHVFSTSGILVARLSRNGRTGTGEAAGVYYTGDTAEVAHQRLEAARPALDPGITREALRALLPPGGARNALDCALWDLEAREAGRPVWQLAGLPAPKPLLTTVTLGADDPAVVHAGAAALAGVKAIKLKLDGDCDTDIARVRAVRAARPDVWLGVDANRGYAGPDALAPLVPVLVEADVRLLEQPFARGDEALMEGLSLPLPTAADESCLDLAELETLPGRFDVVNIKLDKCGGLTEGLLMAERARVLGLKVMVGNMLGTSLALAPGWLLGQLCDIVDLDGPLFLKVDRQPGAIYEEGLVRCPADIWGSGAA
jgi:L-alanine-DL-glutamate epimerase-like enolase superfamily enzyme